MKQLPLTILIQSQTYIFKAQLIDINLLWKLRRSNHSDMLPVSNILLLWQTPVVTNAVASESDGYA